MMLVHWTVCAAWLLICALLALGWLDARRSSAFYRRRAVDAEARAQLLELMRAQMSEAMLWQQDEARRH